MITFIQKNNNGFKWFILDNIYFKGSFYNSKNILFEKYEAAIFFKEIKTEKDFISKVKSINGIFTVIIINNDNCYLSCDPTRIFPIFYVLKQNSLTLSDDVNTLKDNTNNFDFYNEAVHEYQRFGHSVGENTMLKNIYQLQSSEYIIFENYQISQRGFHFSYAVKNYSKLPYKDLKTQINNSIENSFARLVKSLSGKTAVIPLSGGFDSRLIAVMLKKFEYENVICFTYGKKDNIDMKISKKVAESLNFKWYFVEYTDSLIDGYLKTDSFKKYRNSIFNYSSMLFLQEYFAVKYLKENGLIPSNSVIIPGHDGGALGGGYLIKVIPLFLKIKNIPTNIYNHFSYTKSIISKKPKRIESIIKAISNFNNNYESFTPHSIYEDYIFKEITAKVVFNSSKVYDFFGYEHRLPFWDKELLETFKYIPISYKINKKIYVDSLTNLFSLYNVDFKQEIRPSLIKIIFQNFKKIIKPLFPNQIIKNKLQKNDWLNAKKMTDEMENEMNLNNLKYNLKYKAFNEINIQWYLYFCKGLIKK